MRAVVQRVDHSCLRVASEEVASIKKGLVVLVSVGKQDVSADAVWIAHKILNLKIFSEAEKMSRNVMEIGGQILIVSQFTLHAGIKKGKRPSFDQSAPRELAIRFIHELVEELKKNYMGKVVEGRFGKTMEIELHLNGPVTIWLDSHSKY